MCLRLFGCYCFVFLMIRRPPISTRTDTLFPYTTLFRSLAEPDAMQCFGMGSDESAQAGQLVSLAGVEVSSRPGLRHVDLVGYHPFADREARCVTFKLRSKNRR